MRDEAVCANPDDDDYPRRFFDGNVEDWFDEPITWIPGEHNPSCLVAHKWNGKKWIRLVYARFVHSPYWRKRKERGMRR